MERLVLASCAALTLCAFLSFKYFEKYKEPSRNYQSTDIDQVISLRKSNDYLSANPYSVPIKHIEYSTSMPDKTNLPNVDNHSNLESRGPYSKFI